MNIVFLIIYFIWIVSEVLLNRLMRSKASDKQHADERSLGIIWVVAILSIALAVFISMHYYLPLSGQTSVAFVGLAIIATGVILRLIIIRSLGRFFTVDVTIRQQHQLKTDGFYAYLRHPSYFASLLSFIGFGISLNNWLSLLIITVAILTVFANRINVEEKALVEHFGEQYLQYKRHTKGLIPFIY